MLRGIFMQMNPNDSNPSATLLRCPQCRYSLMDLESSVCPECGIELDRPLIRMIEHQDGTIAATRLWSLLGAIAWIGVGGVIWIDGTVTLALRETYGGWIPTPFQIAGIYFRMMIIIAPIAILFGWWRWTRIRLYQRLMDNPQHAIRIPKRVLVFSLVAMVIDLGMFLLIASALG